MSRWTLVVAASVWLAPACGGSDDPCTDVDCSGHGYCVSRAGAAECVCEDGYHPDGLACAEDDVCAGVTCSGHGTCYDLDGAPACNCTDAYHAEGLECVEGKVRMYAVCVVEEVQTDAGPGDPTGVFDYFLDVSFGIELFFDIVSDSRISWGHESAPAVRYETGPVRILTSGDDTGTLDTIAHAMQGLSQRFELVNSTGSGHFPIMTLESRALTGQFTITPDFGACDFEFELDAESYPVLGAFACDTVTLDIYRYNSDPREITELAVASCSVFGLD